MKFSEYLKEKFEEFSNINEMMKLYLNEEKTGTTNTPIDSDDRPALIPSLSILKILNAIETDGVTLSYPSGTMKNHLRFVVTNGTSNSYGMIGSKNDRQSFYEGIMKAIMKNNKNVVLYNEDTEVEPNKIYIRKCNRSSTPIAGIEGSQTQKSIQNSFSSAGGFELYDPKLGQSFFIDLEIKGNARSDSAVNTKLREVTPCVLFELIARGIGNYEINWQLLNPFFSNPDKCFKNLRQQINEVAEKNSYKIMTRLKASLGEDVSFDAIKECFDFDESKPENAYRMKAYRVGVKTLENILKKYNIPEEKKFVERIKYSGLSTMGAGLSGGTEDVMVVQSFDAKTNKTIDIKISLKSGVHKSRETTFVSLAQFIGMFDIKFMPVKESAIKGNTLFINAEQNNKSIIVKEDENTVAKLFFEMLQRANNANKERFAEKIKKFVLPDESMEIWNVTEDSFEDLKDDYLEFYKYKYVNIVKVPGPNKYYTIEMNDGKNNKNDHFVFRWYKRDGKGAPSEFKILAEPNKSPTTKSSKTTKMTKTVNV